MISFTLRTPTCVNFDRHSYRLPVLPRIGEMFVDGTKAFQVTNVVHNAHGTIEVFAEPRDAYFG